MHDETLLASPRRLHLGPAGSHYKAHESLRDATLKPRLRGDVAAIAAVAVMFRGALQ